MEGLKEKLNSNGWFLSDEGIKMISEDGNLSDISVVEKKALNLDIRELGGCAFPAEVAKGKYDSISGNIIVQVQKIRNISAPKSNEESQGAPRLLKFILSDGSQSCTALEINSLPFLSLNTPPGTKLRLKGEIVITSGILHLNSSNVELLGGVVTNLVEKWNMNRSLAKHTRGRVGMEGGPPPWVPFGEKVSNAGNLTDKNFKSLDDGGKENKEDGEFEAQRRDAIAEAGKGCTRKVFGGGTKPLLDKNVQALMDKGYSLQVAENALRQNRNNVDRALRSLQRKTGKGGDDKEKNEKEGGRGGRRKNDEESGPKPSGRVVLFQFLEDKIPFPDKDKNKEKEKEKEWEAPSNKVNYEGNSNYRQKWNQSGASGGGNGQDRTRGREKINYSSGVNERNERKPREDRAGGGGGGGTSRWQNSNQHQKPPRFQNQYNRRNDQVSTNEHYEQYVNRDEGNVNVMGNVNSENYFSTKNTPQTNIQQYNGFRNTFKLDSLNYGHSPGDYRNQNSNYFKPLGMPDIPEFPYKDNSAFMPIINSSPSANRSNPSNKTDKYRWKVGDKCMAKYWEDNMYYNAEVTGISKKTCVVRFLHYGNFEEVLQDDCIPITEDLPVHDGEHHNHSHFNSGNKNNMSGTVDFRRGPRTYTKQDPSHASALNSNRRTSQRYSMPVYTPPPGRAQNNK